MDNIPTRFDRIAQVKTKGEERAREELAAALRELDAAESEKAEAEKVAFGQTRTYSDTAEWALSDLSHQRALAGLSHAEQRLAEAASHATSARIGHTDAYQSMRVFDTLVEHRRAAVLEQRARAEQKSFDDIAIALFSRA